MFRFQHSIYFVASLFLLSCGDIAVEDKKTAVNSSIFDTIYETDMSVLTLSGDLSHLIDEIPLDSNSKEQYFPARLTIDEHDSGPIEIPLRIAKRGVTRKSICDFPPIKFKFNEDTLVTNGYSQWNTYKIVTHCIPEGNDLVIAEYLAYKIYNHLTENSFRVKLVMMEYDDISGRLMNLFTDEVHLGFIIEEDEELAHRRHAVLYESEIKNIDRKQYAQMVVFQYMIGNTDWNLSKGHNVKWIQQKDISSPTPLPYDFDFCGLVDAPHAAPHPSIPIKTVTERFLQWRGKSKEELKEICEELIADKENILDIVRAESHLSKEKKDAMLNYLNSFFDQIETEGI